MFPSLIFLGLSPIAANATSTVATFPGTIVTILTYRKELLPNMQKMPLLLLLSLIGGAFGAWLLLHISNVTFSNVVPYLLLLATLLFTFRTKIIFYVRKISSHTEGEKYNIFYRLFVMVLFSAVAVYGGFFGAGMGILLLAIFSLMGMQSLHEINALRACCGLFANIIALALFTTSGIINWQDALITSTGCMIGSFTGAYYALRLPQHWSRNAIIVIAWSMTIYFFWKQFS